MGSAGCDLLFHCTVKVVSCFTAGWRYICDQESCNVFSDKVAGADNGSVRHGVICVFFRKYMCGVDVLDKGCGGIHVQVYVGCRVFEVVKSYLCVSVPVLDEFTPAVLRIVRLQIVASMVPWNSTAVGSAPDQTATFPEKSLVRLLAVVVGVGVGVVGSHWLYICIFCGPL